MQIELYELLHKIVDKSYEDLFTLSNKLSKYSTSDGSKHEALIKYFESSRIVFLRYLVLVKWSVQAPLVSQCDNVQSEGFGFNSQLLETNDRLFFMHADLNRAKERYYDIHSAIDVLYNGTFSTLPSCIENKLMMRSEPEVKCVKNTLTDLLNYKMLFVDIPAAFTKVEIQDGLLYGRVEGEFRIVLSVQGEDKDSIWKLVDVETLGSDGTSDEGLNMENSIQPSVVHYERLKNVVQRRLNDEREQPLKVVYEVVHDFCSGLALDILFHQGQALVMNKWKNRITVVYNRDEQYLEFSYWHGKRNIVKGNVDGKIEDKYSIRIDIEKKGKGLLSSTLEPKMLMDLEIKQVEISNKFCALSAERILVQAVRLHAKLALYDFIQCIAVAPPRLEEIVHTKLISGELVTLMGQDNCLLVKRSDIPDLKMFMQVSVELRTGKFMIHGKNMDFNSPAQGAFVKLQQVLSTQAATRGIQSAVSNALISILAHEMAQVANVCLGSHVQRKLSLSWEKAIEHRMRHGGNKSDATIDKDALYIPLSTGYDNTYFLAIETNRCAEIDPTAVKMNVVGQKRKLLEEWITTPCFSLVQFAGISSSIMTPREAVILRRFFAFSKQQVLQLNKLNQQSTISKLLMFAVNMCHQQIQLHHFLGDARKQKFKASYNGQGGSSSHIGTCGQIILLAFPKELIIEPLIINTITAHLQHGGGMELRVVPGQLPFTLKLDDKYKNQSTSGRQMLSDKEILFRYAPKSGFWQGAGKTEPYLEMFLREIVCDIRPLAKFAARLESFMKANTRFDAPEEADGQYYIEHMDPFRIVLMCRCDSSRKSVASISTGKVIYRVSIEFRNMFFVLKLESPGCHPLLPYIEAALNIHRSPDQLLEALERTTVPLHVMSAFVEANLASYQFHRTDLPASKAPSSNGVAKGASGKKGGKGMKLGYKGKVGGKGMKLGYTSDKLSSNGVDDKSFHPSALVLIPRAQNRLKLAYSNRCSIEVLFMENQMVRIKSCSDGVPVPSCNSSSGLLITFSSLVEKFKNICSEMASL